MIRIIEAYEIAYYIDATGRCPFLSWRDSLDDKPTAAMIVQRLVKLEAGNLGDCKRLVGGEGIWELRIHSGPGFRIYFGREDKKVILLLCGGIKRTQGSDIKKARKCWLDYQERKS
jgi:putative addiction module killer protein